MTESSSSEKTIAGCINPIGPIEPPKVSSRLALLEQANYYTQLAKGEETNLVHGISLSPLSTQFRAALYHRTAEALQIEYDTGVRVCVCCHEALED